MTEWRLDRLEEHYGTLLGQREAGRDLAALRAEYRADNTLGVDLPRLLATEFPAATYPKLDAVVASVQDHPYTVVVGANATGKTHLLARVAVALGAMGWLVIVTAPGERQLKEQFMARAFGVWQRAGLPGLFHELRWKLDRGEESGILAIASDNLSRYGGYHSPVGVAVFLDEGQGVAPEAWDGLRSTLMGAGRKRWVASGNPLFRTGRFAEVARAPHWHAITIGAQDVPNVNGAGPSIPGLLDAEALEATIRDFGPNSDYVRSRLYAQFPEGDAEGLIPSRTWLERAVARAVTAPPPAARAEPILGCDIAERGAARNAVAVLIEGTVRELVTWSEPDLTVTAQRIANLAHRHGVRPKTSTAAPGWGWITVDCVGVGAGVAAMLQRTGYKTISFAGSETATSEGPGGIGYRNRRTESFWVLRTKLERGQLGLPADEQLFDELMSLRWRPAATGGKIEVELKSDWAARVGRSPDKADAVAMAVVQTADEELVRAFSELNASGKAYW